jgi:hypothetical protein
MWERSEIMMKRGSVIAFLSVVMVICALSLTIAQPTEENLIKAWEKLQKEDPHTLLFQKVEKNLYRFKTDQFPFDGELRILNVIIDDRMRGYEYGSVMGVIEVELVDLPEDILQKYSYSYSLWVTSNTLFYDEESQEWLTPSEYYAKTLPHTSRSQTVLSNLTGYLSTCGYLFILIVVLVIIFLFIHNVQKRNKKYLDDSKASIGRSLEIAEKSLHLSEEGNILLKEILEELKKRETM